MSQVKESKGCLWSLFIKLRLYCTHIEQMTLTLSFDGVDLLPFGEVQEPSRSVEFIREAGGQMGLVY